MDEETTNVCRKVTSRIYINRKICHYSHSAAGEYTREASPRNFFREVSLSS